MKVAFISVLGLMFSISAFSAEKSSRHPASQSCIHFGSFPTLECAPGYAPEEVSDHCWSCVAYTAPTCIKSPTITCVQGYGLSRDAQGCFHCTAAVQNEN